LSRRKCPIFCRPGRSTRSPGIYSFANDVRGRTCEGRPFLA
jgi:hypothetical protein